MMSGTLINVTMDDFLDVLESLLLTMNQFNNL